MTCLLCESSNTAPIDRINVEYIVKSHLKLFKTDFSYLFSTKEIILNECRHCGLLFYSPSVTGDEQYYNVIQKNDWYYRADKEEYHYASTYIKRGDEVLDIGCGSGHFSKYIPDANFTGLEFSPDAIKVGSENGRKIIAEPVEKHATTTGPKYDVVTAFQVLEHVSNIKSFVQAAAACVKPGGKLIFAVPSEESYIKLISNSILNMPPHHISRWTDKALMSVSKVINLDLLTIYHEKLDPIHKTEFITTFISRCLQLDLSSRAKIENRSSGYIVRSNIAHKIARLVSKKDIDKALLPMGQGVVAVYQKKLA